MDVPSLLISSAPKDHMYMFLHYHALSDKIFICKITFIFFCSAVLLFVQRRSLPSVTELKSSVQLTLRWLAARQIQFSLIQLGKYIWKMTKFRCTLSYQLYWPFQNVPSLFPTLGSTLQGKRVVLEGSSIPCYQT